ncbi:MAG: hypothetical protein ACLGGX_03835 [Bdellovibrionia bacterium]
MKFLMTSLIVMAFSPMALAQTAVELMCKQQAKDMAVQFYSSCMDENQKAQMEQMEQLKAEYKAELEGLKKKFEGKLAAVKSGETIVKKEEKAAKASGKKVKAAVNKSKKSDNKAASKLPSKSEPAKQVISVNLAPEQAVVVPEAAATEMAESEVLPLPATEEVEEVELSESVQ